MTRKEILEALKTCKAVFADSVVTPHDTFPFRISKAAVRELLNDFGENEFRAMFFEGNLYLGRG